MKEEEKKTVQRCFHRLKLMYGFKYDATEKAPVNQRNAIHHFRHSGIQAFRMIIVFSFSYCLHAQNIYSIDGYTHAIYVIVTPETERNSRRFFFFTQKNCFVLKLLIFIACYYLFAPVMCSKLNEYLHSVPLFVCL